MTSVTDILNSPDYINANAATKEAIFNKHIASTPDYKNANAATQTAIRKRFGLENTSSTAASPPASEGMPGARPIVGGFDEATGRPRIVGYESAPSTPPERGPLDKTWSAITGGRNLNSDISNFREATRFPSFEDLGTNIAAKAEEATRAAQAGGERAVEGFKSGRPLEAILGAGQQLTGGASILAALVTGAAKTFVVDPAARFFGPDFGERANVVSDMVVTPYGLKMAAKPVEMIANVGARGANVAQNFIRPDLNALIEATGKKAPEIINALRGSTSGIETAAQAAAPASSAGFSKFATELAPHAPETVADAQRTRDALLGARANIAEGQSAEAAAKIAGTVAEPDTQSLGQRLINTAEKMRKTVRDTIIRPAFKNAEDLAGGIKTDISPLTNEAKDLIDTIDPDAAAILSRRLGKFQGETKTTTLYGPGGASFETSRTSPPAATLEDINDVRSAINGAAAKAKEKGDDLGFKRLMDLHKRLDESVVNSTTLPPEAIAAYKDALKTYSTQYAPQFKTGLQVNLFKVKNGEYSIGSTNVIDKFFKNADTTDNFVALFGKNPSAMNDARLGMEGLFRDRVIKDGVIDTKAYEKFMKDYGDQINKLDAAGLNLRSKFDTLVQETDRATASKAAVAETRAGAGGRELPEGPAKIATDARVTELVNKTPAEDLTSLRDAVQMVRRETERERLANTANIEKSGLPIVPSATPSFLNTKLRIITEAYRRIMGRLDTKMAKNLGEMLHDPSRLDEVANILEEAIARKNAQNARLGLKINVPTTAGIPTAGLNALAPPQENRNALVGQ